LLINYLYTLKNTLMKFNIAILVAVFALSQNAFSRSFELHALDTNILLGGQTENAITTAVPFLLISPDARHAALGDGGVATTPDANSAYWNAAKLVFTEKEFGGSLSYTPWLGKIVNDMSVSYLSGFYKITREQAVAVSMKYFDLGDIEFRDINNNPTGEFNPREFSFDATYSRKLTENFSLGLTGRYISSNLTAGYIGSDAKTAHSVAADVGVFYTKDLKGAKSSNLSLGGSISNIGAKITYTDDNNKNFLPVNLRLGGAFKTELDPYNSLTFVLDFNKLMVPTPSADGNNQDKPLLKGMFGSFSDAPGGAKEEFQEITTSVGIEYWYNQLFAGRIGYFNESINKGNRKYFTAGIGFRKNVFGFDIAYLVPTNKRESPLAETVRFTILFQFDKIRAQEEESVTD